jgi:hypothetical protein
VDIFQWHERILTFCPSLFEHLPPLGFMGGHDLLFNFLYVCIFIEEEVSIDFTEIGSGQYGKRAAFLIAHKGRGDDPIEEEMGVFGDVLDDRGDLDGSIGCDCDHFTDGIGFSEEAIGDLLGDDERFRVGENFIAIPCDEFVGKDIKECGIHYEHFRNSDVLIVQAALEFEGVEDPDGGFDLWDGGDQFRGESGRNCRIAAGGCTDRADGANPIDAECPGVIDCSSELYSKSCFTPAHSLSIIGHKK